MSGTTVITGIGSCLPPRVVTNDDLRRRGLDTSDEWIRTRTGIARRRWVSLGAATSDLAVSAGRGALQSAGVDRADLVLLATTTPDRPCPASAPRVAARLGLAGTPAFDLAAVCSGFVYGLVTAHALALAGGFRRVLLIGAETYSSLLAPDDRSTAVIFGDGAGAVLLEEGAAGVPGAIVVAELGSDGTDHHLITVVGGGSRYPGRMDQDRYLSMRGGAVYRRAAQQMTMSAATVLDRAGWAASTLAAFVGHQANQRLLDLVSDRLGVPAAARVGNLAEVGNTAAASIPLAMAYARNVPAGGRTLLTAFGGGLTWGSVALHWPDAVPVHLPCAPVPSNEEEKLP